MDNEEMAAANMLGMALAMPGARLFGLTISELLDRVAFWDMNPELTRGYEVTKKVQQGAGV